jgi:hypothetical protein
MLKILILFVIIIHGIIHVLGFVKAFNYAEIKELKLPISKPLGIIWLFAFFLFIIAAILYILSLKYWLLVAITATVVSQFLIIISWQDAKFGTIINILLVFLLFLTMVK